MSLEIELHAVPHLKGLINVSNISGQQERGSMDSIHQSKSDGYFFAGVYLVNSLGHRVLPKIGLHQANTKLLKG